MVHVLANRELQKGICNYNLHTRESFCYLQRLRTANCKEGSATTTGTLTIFCQSTTHANRQLQRGICNRNWHAPWTPKGS